MTKVLVTGATGFVGRQVMAALSDMGIEAHGLIHRPTDPLPPAAGWHAADLMVEGQAQAIVNRLRPTHLLHLAWCVEHGKFWTDPANLDWLAGSCRLVRAFAESGGRRFVGTGSCVEYAHQEQPCDEMTTPLRPETLYAAAKHAFHTTLAAFAQTTGISHAWGRLFFLIGPGESPARLVPDIARSLLAGRPAICGSGTQIRDFMDVRDAGRAMAALVLSDLEGPVNIASGHPVSIAELVRRLAELAGRPDLLRLGARPDRPGEPPALTAAVSRLQGEAGVPEGRRLDASLRDALTWWRRQK